MQADTMTRKNYLHKFTFDLDSIAEKINQFIQISVFQ